MAGGAGIQNLYANPHADLVSSFELIKHHGDKTKERNKSSLLFYGWGAGIRTPVMTESESVALPLGDTPIIGSCLDDLHIISKEF